jgi:hypothetical protein
MVEDNIEIARRALVQSTRLPYRGVRPFCYEKKVTIEGLLESIPEQTPRHDATLMCETCRAFVRHVFRETIKMSASDIDVMYACIGCGTERVYGRESQ